MDDPWVFNTASISTYRCSGMKWLLPPLLLGELLDAIRGFMGYSLREDCKAARILDWLLYEARLEGRYRSICEVCNIIRNTHVCIAGGSESLEKQVRLLHDCERVIAVDGAVALLSSYGVRPDIIVTDLDGSWFYILEASKAGAVILVHAHGDNMAALRAVVPRIERVAGTVQCMVPELAYMVPGFTDGDRAFGLAVMCDASKVSLYGMNTRERVGWWSKPWLKKSIPPWPEKVRKLRIAEGMMRLFTAYALKKGILVESL